MTPFLTAFDTSHLAGEFRQRWNDAAFEHLRILGEIGYEVSVSRDLNDLVSFWQDHDGQANLFEAPNFNPHYWPSASERDTLLCFLEKDGRQVGSCGYRLIELYDPRHCRPLTLKEAFDEKFYYYEQPEMGPANERCELRPHSVQWIYDCTICVAGALWLQSDIRGRDIFKSFGRLSRILAVTLREWNYSYMVVVFCPANRQIAMEHFLFTEFLPHSMTFRGEPYEVAWSNRADAIRLALERTQP